MDSGGKKDKSAVYKEYNMTKRGTEQDVLLIKAWLLKQPHLPTIRPEHLRVDVDEWLENYLISCKNSVERAKECLDMYFSSKSLLPEVFIDRDPAHPAFLASTHTFHLALLPGLTASGGRALVLGHTEPSAHRFDPLVLMKRLTMMMDILLQEGIDFLGLEVIVDAKHVVFAHLAAYNLLICKKLVDIGLKALPQRIQKIHIINPSSLVETGLSMFKPLLPKKLQERMVVHKELGELQERLAGCELPVELGGEGPSLATVSQDWLNRMVEYRAWFERHDSVRSDESKRVGKCRYQSGDAFGSQGSFRKIEVD